MELRRPHLNLSITLSQRFPLTLTDKDVTTHLLSSGIRMVVAVPASVGPHLLGSIGLGTGIDATHVSSAGPGATTGFWATDPLILAMTSLERAWGATWVSASAGVELDLLATRYLVTRSDGTSTAWTPLRWRPFVALRAVRAF